MQIQVIRRTDSDEVGKERDIGKSSARTIKWSRKKRERRYDLLDDCAGQIQRRRASA